MAKNETRRLQSKQLAADIYALEALENAKGYAPANAALTSTVAHTNQTTMQQKQALETQAEGNLKAARDIAVKAEWDFHNLILAIKQQVIAQFGVNSNEMQGLGLKKKAEYKTRTTKKPKSGEAGSK